MRINSLQEQSLKVKDAVKVINLNEINGLKIKFADETVISSLKRWCPKNFIELMVKAFGDFYVSKVIITTDFVVTIETYKRPPVIEMATFWENVMQSPCNDYDCDEEEEE